MNVEVLNRGSYGGEMIFVTNEPSMFWQEVAENGIKCRFNGTEKWFLLEEICLVKDKRFSQKLIDLVEDIGDYTIPFSVKYYSSPPPPSTKSFFINKKSK
jgi:hypothetical protein